jgi:hypothetical protein
VALTNLGDQKQHRHETNNRLDSIHNANFSNKREREKEKKRTHRIDDI